MTKIQTKTDLMHFIGLISIATRSAPNIYMCDIFMKFSGDVFITITWLSAEYV